MDPLLLHNLKQLIQERRDYIVDSIASNRPDFPAEYRFHQGVLLGLNVALELIKERNRKNLSDEPE